RCRFPAPRTTPPVARSYRRARSSVGKALVAPGEIKIVVDLVLVEKREQPAGALAHRVLVDVSRLRVHAGIEHGGDLGAARIERVARECEGILQLDQWIFRIGGNRLLEIGDAVLEACAIKEIAEKPAARAHDLDIET